VAAQKWDLVCLDCLAGLSLGRLVLFDDEGSRLVPSFQGFWNRWDRREIASGELGTVAQTFLVHHLGHTLTTIESDFLLTYLDDRGLELSLIEWVDDVDELNQREVTVADPPQTSGAAAFTERINRRERPRPTDG
jgi:hypothetical protein